MLFLSSPGRFALSLLLGSNMSTSTERPPSRGSELSFARYLLWFAAVCAVLYVLPLCLVKCPGFEQWAGSSFGPALDFGFQTANQNAEVVLFGDSSAAVGIAPRQMSAALGLKVLNLPNTAASLHVTGDMSLRHYLRANRPPRLIVFYFAPWNLNYSHEATGPRIYEGEEMLARHGSPAEIVAFVRSHPLQALHFPLQFYSSNLPATLRTLVRHQHPSTDVASAMGYADPLAGRPPLPEPCTLPADLLREVPHTTAQELIRTYALAQTRVLVFIAPIPACNNSSVLTGRSYSDLPAAAPVTLPPGLFKLDFTYAHLRPSGVPEATSLLTEAVRRTLSENERPPSGFRR